MDIKYFDHAATTYIKEDVLKEMIPYLSVEYGNPSSLYTIGRNAKRVIDEARGKVASIIGANPKEIYFTSGGTEADNLAIKGYAYANRKKGKHIITSCIEHHAVLNTCEQLEKEGFEVTYLPVNSEGIISIKALQNAIKDDTILITIMYANNEIGTIQPVEEISLIAKSNGIVFHTDAVQAIGNLKIDVKKQGIDMLSLSAHKFYGPKGVGALYVKQNVVFNPIMQGGHQENNKRPSTENVAGIAGLGKAIELAYEDFDRYNEKLITLRNRYLDEIERRVEYIKINGHREKRLPGNANVSFKYVEGEALLLNLDALGICASAGSACSSGSLNPSHVLTSIGLTDDYASGTLRTTFGEHNSIEDVEYLINSVDATVEKLREMSAEFRSRIK